jgi:hypothetical protein
LTPSLHMGFHMCCQRTIPAAYLRPVITQAASLALFVDRLFLPSCCGHCSGSWQAVHVFYQGNELGRSCITQETACSSCGFEHRKGWLASAAAVMLHQVKLLQPLIAACDVLLNACLQQ